jgi:DNA-binding NarL/FixJ family response regulator
MPSQEDTVRILLVDDHPIVREAIRHLLPLLSSRIAIVGEASSAREAVAFLDSCQPDVVVLDFLLPGSGGTSAIRDLLRAKVSCQILIYSAVAEPSFAAEALSAGARGYACKRDPLEELSAAIELVGQGKPYLSPSIKLALGVAGVLTPHMAVASLSPREREIFDLVVECYTNDRIATALFISVKTVETHRTRINKKLGIHSTGELLRFAALHGLVRTSRAEAA